MGDQKVVPTVVEETQLEGCEAAPVTDISLFHLRSTQGKRESVQFRVQREALRRGSGP